MNKEKIRILFCGDSLSSFSGLASISANIMLNIAKIENMLGKKKYEVAYATICGKDSEHKDFHTHGKEFEENFKDLKIYNCQVFEDYGKEVFDNAVKEFKPNIVFSNVDPWYLDPIALSSYRESYFWISYSTIETPFYPDNVMFPTKVIPRNRKSMKNLLQGVDLIIPVTNVGSTVFKDMGLKNVFNDPIYNGIDFSLRCMDDALKKSQVFGAFVEDNDFVFMTLGTNSERKKIDVVVEAFAKFLEKMNWNKKYKLYMHTNVDERIGGTDLSTQILKLGLKDYVFAPQSFKSNKFMSKEDLYRRYQVSDCYIGLPAGEGFGIGNAEAMLHKKPVIYLDYGGPSDYLKDVGLPVKVKETFAARNVYMKWALADTDDAVRQMCRVASDDKLRKQLGEKSFEKVKDFNWDIITKQFDSVIVEKYDNFERSELSDLNLKRIV